MLVFSLFFQNIYVPYQFNIHSSGEGHIGGFYFPAIMYRAAMNMAEQDLWSGLLSPLDICQQVVHMGHMVGLFLAF